MVRFGTPKDKPDSIEKLPGVDKAEINPTKSKRATPKGILPTKITRIDPPPPPPREQFGGTLVNFSLSGKV